MGGGFHIRSVDPSMVVRVVFSPKLGTALRIDRRYEMRTPPGIGWGKKLLGGPTKDPTDCIYDTAYITLQCEAYDQQEWRKFR